MKRDDVRTAEPSWRRIRKTEVVLGGVTYRLSLFAPEQGDGNLAGRLKRLMEREVRE